MPEGVHGTTPARSSAAAVVGIFLCVLLVFIEMSSRLWAAMGVFSAEDWISQLPEFHGHLFDHMLGLGLSIGLWAILHARIKRTLPVAIVVGGLAMWLAPQIFAVLYVWRLFGAVNWGIALHGLVGALPHVAAGAFIAGIMWRIAYGRAERLA